jgi:hypothetical protein
MSNVKLPTVLKTLELEIVTRSGTTKVEEDNELLREQTDAYSGGGSVQLILCDAESAPCSFNTRKQVAAIDVAVE